jgi:sterol desaturase/sphingolipid hydroxylase (fatty acid hydroxylase superfamily)
LSLLLPAHALTAFLAALAQAYLVEEWVYHSVHFYHFRNRYFRYVKRHHMYHHSPKGVRIAFGVTSGFWDVVNGTRIPAHIRAALCVARS